MISSLMTSVREERIVDLNRSVTHTLLNFSKKIKKTIKKKEERQNVPIKFSSF